MNLLYNLPNCCAEKKHFKGNSNSLTGKIRHKVFYLTKNNVKIIISVTRKLQISENLMSCIQRSVIDRTASRLNTEKHSSKSLSFYLPFLTINKKVVSDLFLSISFQIVYTSYKLTANFSKPSWNTEIYIKSS